MSVLYIGLFCIGLVLVLAACRHVQAAEEPAKTANDHTSVTNAKTLANAWNKHMIDSAITLLRSGDLVVRTGNDMTSYMLRQINQKDKTYSHCGIVMIENNYPFVYHSIGGEDNPDARLRRDSASFFFSALHNFGFGIARCDLSSAQLSRLRRVVAAFYAEKPRFDLDFDLKTDDKLYCSEFVYKSIIRATGDSAYIKPTSLLGHTFVGVDDLYTNKHTRLLWQVKYK